MKLQDLFEEQRVIEGDVEVPRSTRQLNYHGASVKGDFICSNTKITSLEGSPKYVGGDFSCTITNINSLVGGPETVVGWFSCADTKITSLEGAPDFVGGNFGCFNTKITSLHNVHKHVRYIGDIFRLSNTIKSHILGVMFIKGLRGIVFWDRTEEQKLITDIINKHLQGDKDPHACQEELIEAGFSEYARL